MFYTRNKSVRNIFLLPYHSHCWLLGPLLDHPPNLDIKFMHRMIYCNKSIVNQCNINASHDANTLIGYKLSFRSKLGYNLYDLSLSQCLTYSRPLH